MSHAPREGKTSNNINININLSMKDSKLPAGKKIENNIRIGPSAMESKRITMLTERLQERKKEMESYNDYDEGEYLKAKMTGYTTKKQRSKTTRMQPEQIVTAFSTTNAKGKFNSRDVREFKDTPVKVRKEGDGGSKQKKNLSSEKLKSRRNSKNCSSSDNLKKLKINRSPAKSQSKSNSKERSTSNRKAQISGIKKNPKMTLDPPKISASDAKMTINSNPGNIKNSKSKPRISHRGNDDMFVRKAPDVKKPPHQKSSIKAIVDNPMSLTRTSHLRRPSNPIASKSAQKRKPSPNKKKLTKKAAAIRIQKVWKGFWTRKNLLNQIESIAANNRRVKQMISDNSQRFWQDSSHNSIKYIDVNIEDSFTEKGKPSLELFSGEEVMSIEGSSSELSPFDRLIKMSQKVGDQKLARELRDMAENLLKEDVEKKKVIRENRQLKQDIIQLKEESIHHNLPIPLILPQPHFEEYEFEEKVEIVMPVKIEDGKGEITERTEKKHGVEKKVQVERDIEKFERVEKPEKVQKEKEVKQLEKQKRQQPEPVQNLAEWNSAKDSIPQNDSMEKQKLIQQLKSFKGQSDSMMKKIQKSDKDQGHLTNSQVAQLRDQPEQPRKQKYLPEIEKPQQLVLDYQMNNESSDSEQFRQAIKRSELEGIKRGGLERSQLLSEEKEKQIKPEEKRPAFNEVEIHKVSPGIRQRSEGEDYDDNPNSDLHSQAQKRGFQTNLNFVKQYCIGLCQYVRSNQQVKKKFKQEVTRPIDLQLRQFLKSYRRTAEKELNNQYNSFKHDYVYPYYRESMDSSGLIKFEAFEKFNETYSTLRRNSVDASQEDIKLEAIHLKSLLDVFNESLNHERPSGVYCEALPWAPKVRHLKNVNSTFEEGSQAAADDYGRENEKFDQLFGVSIARVIQWGSSLCGFIPQSIDMNNDVQIDEEYINHIKETRMALMLQKTLAQDEEKMLEFTDVETQVKLEIGMRIVDDLVLEVFEEIGADLVQDFQYLE